MPSTVMNHAAEDVTIDVGGYEACSAGLFHGAVAETMRMLADVLHIDASWNLLRNLHYYHKGKGGAASQSRQAIQPE